MTQKIRLNKYIALCGLGSRRNADELIKSGKVEVNGEKIDSPDLVYQGECQSEDGPAGIYAKGNRWDICCSEGGPIFIYEMADPTGVVFMVDDYQKVNISDSLNIIYENEEYPWNNNIVYLEAHPVDGELTGENIQDNLPDFADEATIIKETPNSIKIGVNSSQERYMVLSYLYRPDWKAYIGSSEIEVYRAYGGFMAVKVPKGNYIVEFKYRPLNIYFGFLLTAAAFLIPLGARKLRKQRF